MNGDEPLPQDLAAYNAEDRARIETIIEEEKAKTRAMLAPSADAAAILIGGTGAPDGVFTAVNQ